MNTVVLHKTKLLIFDLDGTLIPTMQKFADIAALVISAHHGMSVTEARNAYLATSGAPFFQQLEILFPKSPKNAAAAEDFETRKKVCFFESKMEPDVLHALRALKRYGYILTVSSNNFDELVQPMIQRECADIFQCIFGLRPGFEKGKDHFLELFRQTGATPSESLFVGDSLSDWTKAKAFSLQFVGILGTFLEKDFRALDPNVSLLKTVAQLPTLLETWKRDRAMEF